MSVLGTGTGSLEGVEGQVGCPGEAQDTLLPPPHPGRAGADNCPASLPASSPFLPSFLQRGGWFFQVQARMVVMSIKKTSGSTMASTSIVPARAANRRQHDRARRAEEKGAAFPF